MKNSFLLFLFFLALIVLSTSNHQVFAAIPIQTNTPATVVQTAQGQELKKSQAVQSDAVTVPSGVAATNDIVPDTGIYGILSFSMGLVGWITAGFGFGFLLLLGAFITGIIGVGRRRKYKGLALAGLILGAAGILALLIAILIVAAFVL